MWTDFDNFRQKCYWESEMSQGDFFPRHLTSASALPGEMPKHESRIFSLKRCIIALPSCWLNLFSLVLLLLATHTYAAVWIRKSCSQTVHWLSLQSWWRTTPISDTATYTVTDLVNVEREGNILQDALLPFHVLYGAHSRSLWQWMVVQLWQVIFLCFLCFLAIHVQHLSEQMQILVFLFPQCK